MLSSQSGLNSQVLVLNRSYMAVRVISARRAVSLLFRQIAEIVSVEQAKWETFDFKSWQELSEYHAEFERENHDWIRGVRFDFAVPKIIRLLGYNRLPQRKVTLTRRNLYARDENHCQYCGRKFPTSELSLDHVMPKSRGGKMSWGNIVCACVSCNVKKGARTPEEAGMTLIRPPIQPSRAPVITLKLSRNKYASWKHFLNEAYWNVELRD